MRNAFARALSECARTDHRVLLLSGDIGNRMFDSFQEEFPTRFTNCGIAEANMIGVAAGLSLGGFRPVVYTIVPFLTARCLEQIRVDLCYHQTPCVLVGVGGGLAYAGLGPTHHALEDVAWLRAIPEMTVIAPGDAHEVEAFFPLAVAHPTPVYIRLGKKNEPLVHASRPDVAIGRAHWLEREGDVCVVGTGTALPIAVEVAERLRADGIGAAAVSFPTIKPLDEEFLTETFGRFRRVVTIEEHSSIGGLGSAFAEWRNDHDGEAALSRFDVGDRFVHEVGSQADVRAHHGLDAAAIANSVREITVASSTRER